MRLLVLVAVLAVAACVAAAPRMSKRDEVKRPPHIRSSRAQRHSGRDVGNTATPWPCNYTQNHKLPFCDTSLDIDARVADFVGRIPESCWPGLFSNGQLGCPQVQLPPYQVWSEALHGGASFSPGVTFSADGIPAATQFPIPPLMGATYDRAVWIKFADVMGTELRAMHNSVVGGKRQAGLTLYSPVNTNLVHSQLWGRLQEVSNSEEPLVSAHYSAIVMRHGQYNRSIDAKRPRVATCAKHWVAYSQENWGSGGGHTIDRHNFDAVVDPNDLAELMLPQFEAALHTEGGGALSWMSSYNAMTSAIEGQSFVNTPSSANVLLNNLVRNNWNPHAYLTSDCGAVADVYYNHHFTKTPEEAVQLFLKSTGSIDCGEFVTLFLNSTLQKGLLTRADVRKSLSYLFRVYFVLGLFDPAEEQPYNNLGPKDVCTPEHDAAAYKAAVEGIVLLEHWDTQRFPLSAAALNADRKTLLVVGPNGNATTTLLGNYYGQPPHIITVLEGFAQRGVSGVEYVKGADITDMGAWDLETACGKINAEDSSVGAVTLVLGTNELIESEGNDRTSLELPGLQRLLAHKVVACASRRGIPVAVVYLSGGSVDMSFLNELQKQPYGKSLTALLWAGFPGQNGGLAVADIVLGNVAPSGRLPHSVYPASYVHTVSMLDFRFRADLASGFPGRLYRYTTTPLLYVNGHGLSTTSWAVKLLKQGPFKLPPPGSRMPSTLQSVNNFSFAVTNTGTRASKLSLLLLVMNPMASLIGQVRPAISGFSKTPSVVNPGDTATVDLSVFWYTFCNASDPSQYTAGKYKWSLQQFPEVNGTIDV